MTGLNTILDQYGYRDWTKLKDKAMTDDNGYYMKLLLKAGHVKLNTNCFYDAARNNKVNVVKAFLECGANPLSNDEDEELLPLYAAMSKNNECVDMLIKRCTSVNFRHDEHGTIFEYALNNKLPEKTILLLLNRNPNLLNTISLNTAIENKYSVDFVTKLLSLGAENVTESSETAISTAICYNQHDTLRLLLERGFLDNRAFNRAIESGENDESLEILVKCGRKDLFFDQRVELFLRAIKHRRYKTINLFIKFDTLVFESSKEQAFDLAIKEYCRYHWFSECFDEQKHWDLIKSLIEHVNLKQTPLSDLLFLVVSEKKSKLLSLLFEHGADPNIKGDKWLISKAFELRDVEIILKLIKHGANVNVKNDDWLVVEAFDNYSKSVDPNEHHYHSPTTWKEIIETLINKGADISMLNLDELLIKDIKYAYGELIPILCKNGANIDMIYEGQPLILHPFLNVFEYKSYNKNRYITQKLVVCKNVINECKNVNITDDFKNTPLHLLAKIYDDKVEKLIKRLLSKGADINARNKKGSTPLMFASYYGRYYNAKLLIERGADLKLKNKDGQTAYHTRHKHICKYFKGIENQDKCGVNCMIQ